MTSVRLPSAFDPYLVEFDRPRTASLASPAARPPGVAGRIVREDRLPEAGWTLLQTRDEAVDYLHCRRNDSDEWRSLPLPPGGRAGEARWVRDGESFGVLLVRHRPWWPLGRNYGRVWAALVKPALRPATGLFLLDAGSGDARYLFPGDMPAPSPDRRAVAFLRSERRGFHSLHLWQTGTDESVTVVSLWEADPGSGPSFSWNWSSDSKVLFVRGASRGFENSPERSIRQVRLLYDVEGDRLVELKTAP
jgi:hypothetical protein